MHASLTPLNPFQPQLCPSPLPCGPHHQAQPPSLVLEQPLPDPHARLRLPLALHGDANNVRTSIRAPLDLQARGRKAGGAGALRGEGHSSCKRQPLRKATAAAAGGAAAIGPPPSTPSQNTACMLLYGASQLPSTAQLPTMAAKVHCCAPTAQRAPSHAALLQPCLLLSWPATACHRHPLLRHCATPHYCSSNQSIHTPSAHPHTAHLLHCRFDIPGVGCGHGLQCNAVLAAHLDRTNLHTGPQKHNDTRAWLQPRARRHAFGHGQERA
jgi:hypothetical protein